MRPPAHVLLACLIVIACACGGRDGRPRARTDGGPGADGGPFDAGSRDASMPPGDSGGPGDASTRDAGADPATDTRYFVPDVPGSYSGTLTDPGITIVAHTAREDAFGGLELLIAVRSTYFSPLCAISLDVTFLDSFGTVMGDVRPLVIEGPPHRGVSGTGGLQGGCLSPGQIGMGDGPIDLTFGTMDDIASYTWTVGAINLTDAVPTSDIGVTGVTAVDTGSGRYQFTGTFRNSGSTTLTYPQVTIFGLNAVGRPLFVSSDIETLTLTSGGTWTFATSPRFTETFADYAAFPEAND